MGRARKGTLRRPALLTRNEITVPAPIRGAGSAQALAADGWPRITATFFALG
jgi:hypothetical protein